MLTVNVNNSFKYLYARIWRLELNNFIDLVEFVQALQSLLHSDAVCVLEVRLYNPNMHTVGLLVRIFPTWQIVSEHLQPVVADAW